MPQMKVVVLYPQPADPAQFEQDYAAHLTLLRSKTAMPDGVTPYTVTRFAPTPEGPAPFYLMFQLPFPSAEALQAALASPALQEVAADAARISTGGAPIVQVGAEGTA